MIDKQLLRIATVMLNNNDVNTNNNIIPTKDSTDDCSDGNKIAANSEHFSLHLHCNHCDGGEIRNSPHCRRFTRTRSLIAL